MIRHANTIFSISSLSSIVMGSGALLVCLLVIVKPEASQGLDTVQRSMFWAVHVGAGITAMFIASLFVRQALLNQLSVLPSVILCGLLGTLLVTPLYLMVDHWWPATANKVPDDWLDRLHDAGVAGALLAEFLEVLPWTITAWLMINLPLLNQSLLHRLTDTDNDADLSFENPVQPLIHRRASNEFGKPVTRDQPLVTDGSQVPAQVDGEQSTTHSASADLNPVCSDSTDSPTAPPDSKSHRAGTGAEITQVVKQQLPADSATEPTEITDRFLQSLPGIFGKDIIAVSSDLHYLNVITLAGKTTVLGNLRDVATELQETGLQVHRSHWVAHKHVDRVVNSGGQAAVIMSNGIRVPVSRRRWKTVREYYGLGVINRNTGQ